MNTNDFRQSAPSSRGPHGRKSRSPWPPGRRSGGHSQPAEQRASFGEFEASELYCPRCRQAVPVRSRILLALPEGDKYEYLCTVCSESLGTKLDIKAQPSQILIPGR